MKQMTNEMIANKLALNLDEIRDVLSTETINTMGMLALKGGNEYDEYDDDGEKRDQCNNCNICKQCDKCNKCSSC